MIQRELNVIVADDHELVREGFIKVVERISGVKEVRGCVDGTDVLKTLKSFKADLILMDLEMPNLDGIDTSVEVIKKYPDVSILILSGFSEEKFIYHLIETGVHGYLPKNSSPADLTKAIEDISTKGFHYNELMVSTMRKGIIKNSDKPTFYPKAELTEREKLVLKMLCQEKTTKEIADQIHLSDKTVEKIRANLANKLDVKGTAGLVRYAVQNGLDL